MGTMRHFVRYGRYLCNPWIETVVDKETKLKHAVTCKNCKKMLGV